MLLTRARQGEGSPRDELAATVAVHARKGEGEGVFDFDDMLLDLAMGAVTADPDFDPAGGDIGHVQGTPELSVTTCPTMTCGIHFEATGFPFVPGEIGSDGHLVFQERSGFGVAFAIEGKFFSLWGKPAVDGLPRESGFLGLWSGVGP